uniref:dCTP deaminase n=1 Tax=Parastrongyloides trichosuri TaxID=131310 RepID=A0A0N5A6Z7_PARTI
MDHIDGHDPRDFWEPLTLRRGELLLDPGEFYILASSDDVEIPVDQAAEMTPFDPLGRRVPRPLCRFLRSGLRHGRGARRRVKGRAGSPHPRHPLPAGARPDRRPTGL